MRFAHTCTLLGLLGIGTSGLAACSCSKRAPGAGHAAGSVASGARGVPVSEASALSLCSALHELPRRRRAECCAEPPVSVYLDECVRLLSNAVRARTVSIESSEVARCAARVAETTRGCDWVAPAVATAPAECAGAVRGLVGEGGRCTSSLECRGALHCAGQGATSPGVCKAPQGAGSGCGTSVDSLATYLGVRALETQKPLCDDFCDLTTHRCAPKPAAGAACRAGVNCASDQTCRSGRCERLDPTARAARSRPGEACATDLDCAAGGCVPSPGGERRCAKKCSTDFASFAARPSSGALGLGATPRAKRTSTRSESTSR